MRTLFFLLMLGVSLCADAQERSYQVTPLPLNDLQAFKSPAANWKIVGGILCSPADETLKASKGTGVLFNDFTKAFQYKREADLTTVMAHGDIFLSLDFLLPKGSNSGIYFQSRYELQLADSWRAAIAKSSDCGGIYERWNESKPEGQRGYDGHAPRTNATLAPGLWQHLEVEFQAARFDHAGKCIQPARFVRVVLNGVVIHENVILSGPTRGALFPEDKNDRPLLIQGDHGPVAFRNIEYALLNDFEVPLKNVSYTYYEGKFSDFSEFTPDKVTRTGKAEAIDIRVADNPNAVGLVFNGMFTVNAAADYEFTIAKIGSATFSVDGEEIIGDKAPGGYVAKKSLAAGDHTFTLRYRKNFSWAPSGVGVYISKPNNRPVPLHAAASLPRIPPAPFMQVNAATEPEIIRSFMQHHGKKRTHILSVGTPQGTHYAYDLNQAGLLATWRGDFLNVTDMWYERGEPQTAAPLGATLVFADRAPLAAVATASAPLPDTLDYNTALRYKGYTLDAARLPVFEFQYQQLTFTDALRPANDGRGLVRTLGVKNVQATPVVFVRLAEGKNIHRVADDLYAIDDQRYYIRFTPAARTKAEIRNTARGQELVYPFSTAATIEYSVIW